MSRRGATRRGFWTALACAGVLAAGAGAALAADTITADPSCCTFGAAQYQAAGGESPRFSVPAGADASHDIAATRRGPDGKPLFSTRTVIPGRSASVQGAQYLAPGSYRFICRIHGSSMSSTLVVSGGRPEARPRVDVKIPGQRLAKVSRSGKLTVRVKAATASRGVALVVRKGARKIGSKARLNLAAGASRTLKVRLTGAGKRALRKARRAAVKVQATVPFGKPDRAARTLR